MTGELHGVVELSGAGEFVHDGAPCPVGKITCVGQARVVQGDRKVPLADGDEGQGVTKSHEGELNCCPSPSH